MNNEDQSTTQQLTGKIASAELTFYAIAFAVSFVGYAYLLANNAQVSVYMLCGPAMLIGFGSFFFRIFAAVVVPCFVFAGFVLYGFFNRSTLMNGWEAHAIVLAGVASIFASARLLALSKPVVTPFASRRVNFSPVRPQDLGQGTVGWGHLLSLPMLILAWWSAGHLSNQLSIFATSRRAYQQAYAMLHERVGILPEWYVGLKALFLLTILLWICRQIFAYLALRRQEPSVAAMHLRSELWRWDGAEQRMVGKQLGKRQR